MYKESLPNETEYNARAQLGVWAGWRDWSVRSYPRLSRELKLAADCWKNEFKY